MPYALSFLDKSPIHEQQSSHQALAGTLSLARKAEELGFKRFWVAEHHNTAKLASSSPEVMIAFLLAQTKRIRIGSGGVMLQSVYRGERQRAWGILTPADTDFYDKSIERAYGFDAKLANSLLDEAGWTARDAEGFRTKDGKRLTIEIIQSQVTLRDQRDILLQAVQAQARQNAGIDLALQYVDTGTYANRQKDGQYGIIPNSTTTQENGTTIYFHYLPRDKGGSINYSRTEAPEISAWLDEAASTLDAKKRFEIYAKLQRFAVLEQAYGLPLYVPEDQIAASAQVQGVGFRSFKRLPENAYDIWLQKQA